MISRPPGATALIGAEHLLKSAQRVARLTYDSSMPPSTTMSAPVM
jgi:hypothetical protein